MFLEAQHIDKSFGDFKALDDVGIGVREGTVFGLLGPNGAGKTTLIRIVNRIIHPDNGTLLLNGNPMTDNDVQKIGYLPEERGLYKKMRVGDQALYLAQLKGLSRHEAAARLHKWFERFEMSDWWNCRVEELSKGMQQKVQFVVTVLHEPKLLIFDEPFSGFDPVNATMLKNEILALKEKGATVIFSTHNMASVEELCDDIALINKSHVVLKGSVNDIRRSYSRNLFEIVATKSETPLSLPQDVRITKQQIDDEEETSFIMLPDGMEANELLGLLMPQRSIRSFREVLPTMNDIFIKAVDSE